MELVQEPVSVPRTLLGEGRVDLIRDCFNKVRKLNGHMAEIGVYQGGISQLMASSRPDSTLYSCDGFEGLPDLAVEDNNHHKKGDFNDVTYEEVKDFLSSEKNAIVIKGFFPDGTIHQEMFDKEYFLVHVDVDLYQSTKDCLEFFYPRMVIGGIIMIDDYPYLNGVKIAVNEFKKQTGIKVETSIYGQGRITKKL